MIYGTCNPVATRLELRNRLGTTSGCYNFTRRIEVMRWEELEESVYAKDCKVAKIYCLCTICLSTQEVHI